MRTERVWPARKSSREGARVSDSPPLAVRARLLLCVQCALGSEARGVACLADAYPAVPSDARQCGRLG